MEGRSFSNENNFEYLATIGMPSKPEEPLPSDCCGSGCSMCVFDIYQRDLENWEKECKEIRLNGRRKNCEATEDEIMSKTEFRPFELESVICHTIDTAIYKFKLPQETLLNLNVGQHLILRSFLEGKWITRSYTPINFEDGYFDVMIKIYPNGLMSKCVLKWSIGDMVDWRGPFGSLIYKPNQHKHMVLLAAGTGIAPMLQVIKEVVDNEKDETFIKLFYSCRKAADILMKHQLDEYKQFWNFQLVYFLTKSQADDDKSSLKYGDDVIYGRLDREYLSQNFPRNSTRILICGTRSFEKDMINHCLKIGFGEDDIFKF